MRFLGFLSILFLSGCFLFEDDGPLEVEIKTLNEDDACQDHSQSVIEEASDILYAIVTEISDLYAQVDELREQLNEIDDQELREQLESEINQIEEDIDDYSIELNEGFERINEYITNKIPNQSFIKAWSISDITKLVVFSHFVGEEYSNENSVDNLKVEALLTSSNSWVELTISGQTRFTDLSSETKFLKFASVLDNSYSMYQCDLEELHTALSFLYQDLPAIYESAIIKFGTAVHVTQDFTSDSEALSANADLVLRSRGLTALIDGVYETVTKLTLASDEDSILEFVVVFTDGYENASGHSLDELIEYITTNKTLV